MTNDGEQLWCHNNVETSPNCADWSRKVGKFTKISISRAKNLPRDTERYNIHWLYLVLSSGTLTDAWFLYQQTGLPFRFFLKAIAETNIRNTVFSNASNWLEPHQPPWSYDDIMASLRSARTMIVSLVLYLSIFRRKQEGNLSSCHKFQSYLEILSSFAKYNFLPLEAPLLLGHGDQNPGALLFTPRWVPGTWRVLKNSWYPWMFIPSKLILCGFPARHWGIPNGCLRMEHSHFFGWKLG